MAGSHGLNVALISFIVSYAFKRAQKKKKKKKKRFLFCTKLTPVVKSHMCTMINSVSNYDAMGNVTIKLIS